MPAGELFIGLMSGTSADAIDAALVLFDPKPTVLAARSVPLPAAVQQQIRTINADTSLAVVAKLDVQLGRLFATAAQDLLHSAAQSATKVHAIGSHGQTVWHQPAGDFPFSTQIGDPNIIAQQTGIMTIADFRRRDMAAGGQGAPLVPAFHREIFGHEVQIRCVLNLGGIANITVLRPDGAFGFDTGPANTLLDGWSREHLGVAYDVGGQWAAGGRPNEQLLQALLKDPYFSLPPPKSTGPEHFSRAWLQTHLDAAPPLRAQDVQATLVELSARSVVMALQHHAQDTDVLLVCGGGVHNQQLMKRLTELMSPVTVASTETMGIDPDYVEACAFAWLARQRLLHQAGNLPEATGANAPVVLGGIYAAGI